MVRLKDHLFDKMDAPGRSKGAGERVRALSAVIDYEIPHALEDVTRDLERARMTAEDFRQGNAPAFTNDGELADDGEVTWRQRAASLEDATDELNGAIRDAIGPLRAARADYGKFDWGGHVSDALDILAAGACGEMWD